MRRTLGSLSLTTLLTTVLVAGLLGGCGTDQGSGTPRDPASTSSAPEGGPVDFTQVALVSATSAGGEVDPRATALPDDAALAGFVEQFEPSAMPAKLRSAYTKIDVPAGRTIAGAVVSVGCDVPPGVAVTSLGDGLAITPLRVLSPMQECFDAVTTVALVLVDADAV